MHAGMNEFLEEQTRGLKEMAENLRKSQLETARKAALRSAARVRSLNAGLAKWRDPASSCRTSRTGRSNG